MGYKKIITYILISTHTPHARRDIGISVPGLGFLLTRLMRGVTVRIDGTRHVITISTHTPHARRDVFALCR